MGDQGVLTARLRSLYEKISAPTPERRSIIPDLVEEFVRLYSQPHRHYHTLRHISECLQEFDEVSLACSNHLASEMAIWYHDIIYEPSGDVNERLSANKANFDCIRLGVMHKSFADNVAHIIMATKHASVVQGDAAIVMDADLAILGSSSERFAEYEGQIRKEHGHLSDHDYATGRTLVLDGFMRRPIIYATDYFKDKYEKTARANIAMSLMKLTRAG